MRGKRQGGTPYRGEDTDGAAKQGLVHPGSSAFGMLTAQSPRVLPWLDLFYMSSNQEIAFRPFTSNVTKVTSVPYTCG